MIKFVGSFENVKSLPNTRFAEYAFVGRSNVGKSSLINAIVNEKIARTSNTPGRTQSLNLFNYNDKVMIVDLPGYDLDLMDFCDNNGICYQIVYTKKDKRVRETEQVKIQHDNHPAMVECILETSAEKKTGLDELRNIIGVK